MSFDKSYRHHHNQDREHSQGDAAGKVLSCAFAICASLLPSPILRQQICLCHVILLFLEFHEVESYNMWFLYLDSFPLHSAFELHPRRCVCQQPVPFFFFTTEWYSPMWIYDHLFSIHLLSK